MQDRSSLSEDFIGKTKRALKHSFEQNQFLSQKELAEMLHVSQRTLIRKLSKNGMQYRQIINDIQLDKAKHLLESTDMLVKQVCLEVGFKNVDAFGRSFKRGTGYTPRQWRQKTNSENKLMLVDC